MFNKRQVIFLWLVSFAFLMIQGCKPSLVVDPQKLEFARGENAKSFEVWNGTRLSRLDFTVEPEESWISVSPSGGSSSGPGDKKTVTVSISWNDVPASGAESSIVVKSSQAGEKVVEVVVSPVGEGEGEGQVGEGEGQVSEGEGQVGEGEGQVSEGEGQVGEGEGQVSEGEGQALEGEGQAAEGEGEGELPPQEEISIIGWVKDVNDSPIGYATIELVSTSYKVYSDPTGLFVFEGVEDGTYVLSVKKKGYPTYSREIELGSVKPLTVNVTLKNWVHVDKIEEAEMGGIVVDPNGNSLNIPPNGLVDKDGNSVVGEVDVYITPLDLSNPKELDAFPGGFEGISMSKNGERVMLESFALADVKVMQDGEELNINPAKANDTVLTLSLPDDTPLQVGEEVPLWYFDEEQGLWIESGRGIVIEDGGKKFYQASIPHLSWWNCDAPLEDKNCITGMVEDGNGYPLAGAMVRAVGVSYNGVTTGYTDTNGYFCLNVKRNSTFDIEVYLPGGNFPVAVQGYTGVDSPASCETGGCIEILEPIIAEYNSCVHGYVKDANGNPVAGAVVRSSIGTVTETNSEGYYCLDVYVPQGEESFGVTVFVVSRPPVSVTVYPDTSCGNSNCAEANIEVEYPENGDYVGYIAVSESKYKYGENETYYSIYPYAVFATFPDSPLTPSEFETCGFTLIERPVEQEEMGSSSYPTPNWSGLDPGSPGYFSSENYNTNLVRYADLMIEWGWGSVEPWMYSVFTSESSSFLNAPINEFACFWPGGLDIDEFTVSSVIPPELIITSPPYQEGYYFNTFDYNPDEDLVIEWLPSSEVPSGMRDYIQIMLSVIVQNWSEQGGSITQGIIVCNVEDDGSYTIPTELLQQLPEVVELPNTYGYVILVISRIYVNEVEVPLIRGGFGKLQVHSSTQFSMSYYPNEVVPVSAKGSD